jgi:phosphoserine phosphatase RsbU/P
VSVACGGHPLPLVLRADGTVERLGRPGTMLGILPDIEVHDDRTILQPGDALVLYTDGVTEARFRGSGTGRPPELFGDERLDAVVAGCRGLDAAAVAARIETAVLDFSAGRPRDDIALVVVRVPPGDR